MSDEERKKSKGNADSWVLSLCSNRTNPDALRQMMGKSRLSFPLFSLRWSEDWPEADLFLLFHYYSYERHDGRRGQKGWQDRLQKAFRKLRAVEERRTSK
jgi:hypothetical protein